MYACKHPVLVLGVTIGSYYSLDPTERPILASKASRKPGNELFFIIYVDSVFRRKLLTVRTVSVSLVFALKYAGTQFRPLTHTLSVSLIDPLVAVVASTGTL